VGRFVKKKGLGILQELVARFREVQWLFIGWGPEDPLKWRERHVRVMQGVAHEQLADFYRCADLLVLPSTGEGFPLVVQEAMACGTPALISTEVSEGAPLVRAVCWSAPRTVEGFAMALESL